jgi:hypothetical protein
MGGTKEAVAGSPANGILLHPLCHARIESDRLQALQNGWLVRQGIDPAVTPIRLWVGWVTLTLDGSMRSVHGDGTTQVYHVSGNELGGIQLGEVVDTPIPRRQAQDSTNTDT